MKGERNPQVYMIAGGVLAKHFFEVFGSSKQSRFCRLGLRDAADFE
jgi:hypothetical protein